MRKAVESVSAALDRKGECEVIVVDDASGSDHRSKNENLCREYSCTLLVHDSRRGAAASRNTAIAQSNGKWIAFLDDDVIADKQWYFQARKRIMSASDAVAGIEGKVVPLGKGLWDKEVENKNGKLYLTCNCIYNAAILKKENGFDQRFNGKHPSCEDHELAARMLRWGDIPFDGSITVYHTARSVSLIAYVQNSVSRMKEQLEAEFYFYMKQRDRYHLFRHRTSFFGTLKAICLKHIVTTFKRRLLPDIIGHPLQSLSLFASCIIEQLTAWVLLPVFVGRFFKGRERYFTNDIDLQRTSSVWNFKKSVTTENLVFKRSVVKSMLFPITNTPGYSARSLLRVMRKKIDAETECKCYIRIDDVFLEKRELVVGLCKVFQRFKAPFCAAVPGQYLTDERYADLCSLIIDSGGTIALHGFSHHGMFGPYVSEFLQMQFGEFARKVENVFRCTSDEWKPKILIPPFNAISRYHIKEAAKYFKVICGGPETARFTDGCFGPVALTYGTWYFPSFYPFYSNAKTVNRTKALSFLKKTKGIACVTLHMEHEAQNNYADISELLQSNSPIIFSWESYLS